MSTGLEIEFGSFLHVAVTTGARRGELCALKWERIDWEPQTLTISQAIVEVHGDIRSVENDTKTHAIRRIAVDELNRPGLVGASNQPRAVHSYWPRGA